MRVIVIFIIIIAFIDSSFYFKLQAQTQKAKEESDDTKYCKKFNVLNDGDTIPKTFIKTIDGVFISYSTLKKKTFLINFFATWCKYCIEEMPHLQKLKEQLSNDSLIIVSVAVGHTSKETKLFRKKTGYDLLFMADSVKRFTCQFFRKGACIPRNYIIKGGKIIYSNIGFGEEEFGELRKKLMEISK